jgi:mono/diheme cytochrome c family protein
VPIDRARADAFARGETPTLPEDTPPFHDGSRPSTWDGWVSLGRRVFHELPLRTEPYWTTALRDPEVAERLGIDRAPDGSVPGLVLTRDLDGGTGVAITCALCHAAPGAGGGAFVEGRARRSLDYGLARIELASALTARGVGRPLPPEAEARFRSWGRGRADVLEELSEVPIAIPDLYGLRDLRWLTQGATLRHESPIALAVRQETQYVQANHLRTRPPRVLVWALAVFLYAIEPPPAQPRDPAGAADEERGRAIFAERCRDCHWSEVGSGDPTELARIGTEPELATGHARGTGTYRPAPLVRVGDAAPYLHHGAVPTLEELLSPTRAEPGHPFGTDLPEADRRALASYLRTL